MGFLMSAVALQGYTKNRLLAGLSSHELQRLLPHFEIIPLPQNKVLFEARDDIKYVYFPMSGLVSLLGTTRTGDITGIALVGSEGMIGVPLVLRTPEMPYQVVVQIPGESLRMDAEVFKRELKLNGEFEDRLLKYSNTLLDHIGQSRICNQFHSIEARFCCELLVSRDRVGSDTLVLTQEIISHMLGAPRTGITKVANDLRDAGIIRYRRGKITVSNREAMERLACDCYRKVKPELNHVTANA
jgi:CRP-like cAMP-binding protein